MNILKIQKKLKKFAEKRDWEKFHSLKNLSISLSLEASELMEIFQWENENSKFYLNNLQAGGESRRHWSLFTCKIWLRCSRERALSNLPDRAQEDNGEDVGGDRGERPQAERSC